MKINLAELLYYIGGGIVFVGTFILMLFNWSKLSAIIGISLTLGIGLITFFTGVAIELYKKYKPLDQAFYLISAFLIPVGLNVVYYHIGLNVCSKAVQAQIYGILFLIYLLSYLFLNNIIFIIFDIIFGTLFVYYTILYILELLKRDVFENHNYLLIAIGIIYLLLARFFESIKRKDLSIPLYILGLIIILFASFMLGGCKRGNWAMVSGYRPMWQFLFPIICIGFMFLGNFLKEKYFLFICSFALMIFLLKISFEHITPNLGLTISTIISGLFILIIGTLLYKLSDKYK